MVVQGRSGDCRVGVLGGLGILLLGGVRVLLDSGHGGIVFGCLLNGGHGGFVFGCLLGGGFFFGCLLGGALLGGAFLLGGILGDAFHILDIALGFNSQVAFQLHVLVQFSAGIRVSIWLGPHLPIILRARPHVAEALHRISAVHKSVDSCDTAAIDALSDAAAIGAVYPVAARCVDDNDVAALCGYVTGFLRRQPQSHED
mmetsp:Transcript_1425/g.4542  ORF Transcript_1425/g.4542 Transcript_1425/m.4542 type:complete len:200 (+) Transcript_1425:2720-3319(+)